MRACAIRGCKRPAVSCYDGGGSGCLPMCNAHEFPDAADGYLIHELH